MVILGVRENVFQPFEALNWLDLRIGWFLSLTKATNDDDQTGLAESIGTDPTLLSDDDRFRIGVTDSATGTTFMGYTNRGTESNRAFTSGESDLVSSDAAIGTSNAFFWRPKNSRGDSISALMLDSSTMVRAISSDGVQPHFPQVPASAGGYATMLAIRLKRDNVLSRANMITMTMKQGTHSSNILFTNTPSRDILQANLESFPATVQTFGPVQMSQVPDTIVCYWPWHNSKLRIHCMGILKFA
jgi:hypothetical protein